MKSEKPVEQPKPEDAPPTKLHELSAQEKRANAARFNAMQDLAKVTGVAMQRALQLIEMQLPGGQKLILNASPVDLMQLIGAQQQRIQQLEISLEAIVDMLMQTKLVCIAGEDEVDNPIEELREKIPKVPRYMMGPASINLEQYWLMAAGGAERAASVLRRGILSSGAQGDKPLIKQ